MKHDSKMQNQQNAGICTRLIFITILQYTLVSFNRESEEQYCWHLDRESKKKKAKKAKAKQASALSFNLEDDDEEEFETGAQKQQY